MAFPDGPLGSRVELYLGGAWQDVTGDVLTGSQIEHSRGQADRATTTDPASCTVTFRNTDGQFTPRNPLGPWYGMLGRNTALRLSVPGGVPYLGLSSHNGIARTTTTLPNTGDLDVRVDATLEAWQGGATGGLELAGRYSGAGSRSWLLFMGADGSIALNWSADGTATAQASSTQPVPYSSGRLAVRAVLTEGDAVNGHVTTFYTAPTMSGPWTQLGGPVVGAGVATQFGGTSPLDVGGVVGVGYDDPQGMLHAFQLWRAGVLVADLDFATLAPGTTSWTDSVGVAWQTSGAATVADRYVRMVGEVPAWPPQWEPSGAHATTTVTAAGLLRRLAKGDRTLPSTLRRDLSVRPGIVAYWPMEDGEGATQYASVLSRGTAMRTTRVGMTPAAYDGYEASAPLPTLGGGSASGPVPGYNSSEHATRAIVILPDQAPTAEIALYAVSGLTAGWRWQVRLTTAGFLRLYATRQYGDDELPAVDHTMTLNVTGWRAVVGLDLTESGTTVSWRLYVINIDDPGSPFFTVWQETGSTVGATLVRVTRVEVGGGVDAGGTAIGHVTVASAVNAYTGTTQALIGWAGETATTRMARVAADAGIPIRAVDSTAVGTSPVGAQTVATGLGLIQEAAAADGGILGEAPDRLSLEYRSRGTLYNQTPALTLDYRTHLAPPFESTEDDDGSANDITVTRTRGSSARAVLETGGALSVDAIGRYQDPVTLNLADDAQVEPAAWWKLHIGTWDEARYPSVTIRLHRHPELIPAVLAMRDGDRIRITGLPLWVAPGAVDLLAVGLSETIEDYRWEVTWTCVPAGPYEVGVLDDPAHAKVDTDGSQLSDAVDAAATALTVATTVGLPWIQQAPALAVDTFGRAESSGWGTAEVGGAWSVAAGPPADFSVAAGVGVHTHPTVNAFHATTTGPVMADVDEVVTWSTDTAAVTDSHYVWLCSRWATANTFLAARVQISGTGALILSVRDRVAGAETQLASFALGTHTVGASYRLRLQVQGTTARARCWLVGTLEPSVWQVSGTTAITAAGVVGLRSLVGSASTAPRPVRFLWSDFEARAYSAAGLVGEGVYDISVGGEQMTVVGVSGASSPQTFTVVRAVNGVVKAHPSGDAVSLAQPMIIAL